MLVYSGVSVNNYYFIMKGEKVKILNAFAFRIFGGRDGTRLCSANPASSATVALQQYPPQTSELKTVHRTVFLTLLTPLGFKPRSETKKLTEHH